MNWLNSSLLPCPKKQLIATILLMSGCLVGILQLQKFNIENIQGKQPEDFYEQQEQQTALNLTILRNIPSSEFDNLLANWMFLRFIQYNGNRDARRETGYSLNPEFFRAIIERDPRFISSYFLLSPATTLFAASPEVSVEVIEKGIEKVSPEKFPRAYYLWLYKGVDEMLFLGETSAAIHSYEMAAEWASLQDTEEAQRREKRAREMVAFLKENPQSREAQINAWGSILSRASNEETRELVIERIRDLGGDVVVTPEGRLQIQLPEEE